MPRAILVPCIAAILVAINPVSSVSVGTAYDGSPSVTVTHDDGIAACTQLIQRNPEDAVFCHVRGDSDKFPGDFDRGYGRQVRVAANKYASIGVLKSRARASLAKGDYESAIADYDEVIRLTPDSALAYIDRGQAYSAKADDDRAIADFDHAVRIAPIWAAAYNGRGGIYLRRGDYDRAIADFDAAIRLEPQYAHAWNNRGKAYDAKGEHERAIADFDQAIRLDPALAEAQQNRERAMHPRQE
jgi:tetratricopeptide (TPR) repeat protein